jgi:hypothetical protein
MNRQRADAYLLASNANKALVMAFKDVFNESIDLKSSGGQVQQALTS